MIRLNAQELRELEEKRVKGEIREIKRNPIYFILENIYDTYNIGGLFRLADALAIEKMYLCGTTEIPPNTRIKKASIGTYKIVPWEYKRSSKEAITDLRSNIKDQISNLYRSQMNLLRIYPSKTALTTLRVANQHKMGIQIKNQKEKMLHVTSYMLQVIAVEQHPQSIDYQKAEYRVPLALIFGNESYGIKDETLKLADQIVEIPMWGINRSLNVIVSAGIVSYWAMSQRI